MESYPGYTVTWGKSKGQNTVCRCLCKKERGQLGKHTCVCSFVKQTSHTHAKKGNAESPELVPPWMGGIGRKHRKKGGRGLLCLRIHLTVASFGTMLYFATRVREQSNQQGQRVGQSGTEHRKNKLICFAGGSAHPHQGRARGMWGTRPVTSEHSLWLLHP